MILFFCALLGLFQIAAALSTKGTILILARDAYSAQSAGIGLQGYGIPYETLIVPASGIVLPQLAASTELGNYGGFVVVSEVSYQYGTDFLSALTTDQWNQLYNYQNSYGVRMVRLDAYPSPEFGVTPASSTGSGCCNSGQEQVIFLTDTSEFPAAGLKTNAQLSTIGLWHYPAVVTNTTSTTGIAAFGANSEFPSQSVAAVINKNGARQQMVWFTSWAGDWSITSTFLQHAWVHWLTRSMYSGFRRVYLNTQVDDVFLATEIYDKPTEPGFRIRPSDMENHVNWLDSINSRMPSGSLYFSEMGHNGNGVIESAVSTTSSQGVCTPRTAIEYAEQADVPYDFVKPLGTGSDVWPSTPSQYVWSSQCAILDPLLQWFSDAGKRDKMAHVSHTFTHYELNNATYADAAREISFNRAWLQQAGFTNAARFSTAGLIPPAITGLLNGDVIRAWLDNGITAVVGDNTRPTLLNSQNSYWPLVSTSGTNGQDGMVIMPRWATTIYYNCDLPACTALEWEQTSAGVNDFQVLLQDARATNVRHLLALRHDGFMFHQANLRSSDVQPIVVNGVSTPNLSIMEAWVETVVNELGRLTTWPIRSLKHDDLAKDFLDRMSRDQCKPEITYNLSSDGSSIVGVTLTSNDGANSCGAAIPITFPGPIVGAEGFRAEQLGSDPLTVWVTLSGQPQTFTLVTPIPR